MRSEGDAALEERRHGHPHKVTPSVREWLIECCRGTPDLPGRVLRDEIEERFGVTVSITHINRVRAELGMGNSSRVRGGKPAATG
ncbi:MAG: helix-turn-helix domain-containing protein [Chloroflexota bacterium]|nr:helix-turn-helix domain-containing protein [Chloroflexota bacterium]